jgi:hypothetical protein
MTLTGNYDKQVEDECNIKQGVTAQARKLHINIENIEQTGT